MGSSDVWLSDLPGDSVDGADFESRASAAADLDRRLLLVGKPMAEAWRSQTVIGLADLFADLCESLGVRTLIECGAHDAEASRAFLRRNTQGHAIALEANPRTYRDITSLAAEEGVTVLCEGIADVPGSRELLVPLNSLSMVSFRQQVKARGRVIERITVSVTTLDTLRARFALEGSVALWIDVEGMSPEVLRGGKQLLNQTELVMVEVEKAEIWHGPTTASEVDRILALAGFVAVARDFQTGERLYNVIYARNGQLSEHPSAVEYWQRVCSPPRCLYVRRLSASLRRLRGAIRKFFSRG